MKRETALMFDPIRGATVVFVATGIHHALHEYHATGRKVVSRFDNTTSYSAETSILIWRSILFANCYATGTYQRMQATWEDQVKDRQDRILEMIREKVVRQVGLHHQDIPTSTAPVSNPYSQCLDDLNDLEDDDELPLFPSQRSHTNTTGTRTQHFAAQQQNDLEDDDDLPLFPSQRSHTNTTDTQAQHFTAQQQNDLDDDDELSPFPCQRSDTNATSTRTQPFAAQQQYNREVTRSLTKVRVFCSFLSCDTS